MDEKKASGRWSAAERKLHINHLELLSVFRGVQRFLRHLRNKRVTVHLDNVTAAAYPAKEGGTRSKTLNALAKEILIFCRDHGIALRPAYLPGIANLGADTLSRGTETREWFINQKVSERIFSRLGLPQINLFASMRSAQVKTYFSLDRRDNHSAGTNALNQSWTFKHMYAFPSTSDHSSDSGQDEGMQGNFDPGDALLVEGSLVAGAASDGGSRTFSPSSTPEHSEGSEHRDTPPIVAETEADGLAHMRETFRVQGAEFICGSWRGSTKTQYACAWRNWSEWCRGFAIPRTTPTVGQFLKYLWFLYEDRHMAWSTISVHRAAVATIIDPLTNSHLSQHPMVCRFMKAVFLARPPPRKVEPIPEEFSRQKITWRVVMLLALASARRASDLSLLHIDEDHLFKTNDSWRFHLVFGAKQDRPGHIPQDVIILKQACRELCSLENLREYLRRTEGGERQPHAAVPHYCSTFEAGIEADDTLMVVEGTGLDRYSGPRRIY